MGRDTREGPLACVIGDSDLLRPLALARIDCALFTTPSDPSRASRFVRFAFDWDDPWHEPERAVEQLLAFARGRPQRPVLFYEDDASLLLLSRYRDQLGDAFRFVVAERGLVEALVDKRRFAELAARHDLPVPASRALLRDEPLPAELGLRFPLIVKPLTRREPWDDVAGGAKAVRVESAADLHVLRDRSAAAGLDLLVQELVDGPETAVESYHCYVDGAGTIAGEFTGRKIRTWPPELGYSTSLVLTDDERLAALGRDVVSRIGLRGVAKLDFKRAADGTLFLLEVNARFNLWHHLGARAGVNLPLLVYNDLVGVARLPARRARAGARWCWLGADLRAARAAGIPTWRWLPWALRADAKPVLALDDPLPALLEVPEAAHVAWGRRVGTLARAARGAR
jgi:predicted ATP-grasp superfamily ATP-dependent carboligase